MRIVELGPARSLFLGEVVLMHVADAFVRDATRCHIDPPSLQVLGRMQGNSYIRTREIFEMMRHLPEPGKAAT